MRNKHAVLGTALAVLVVSGSVWAASDSERPVVSKRSEAVSKTKLPKITITEAAASTNVGNTIIDEIDYYEPGDSENYYHSKITDPSVPWSEKCQLAIRHGRLELLSTESGGNLGGTIENGRSILRARLFCPELVAVFDIPADFVVHSAPHPEEVQPMSFETQMNSIRGVARDVGPFAYFSLVGGDANGFPSPGRTSLIRAEDGYAVDSTFNIGYRIEWVGAPDGPLAGGRGVSESSILMKAVGK